MLKLIWWLVWSLMVTANGNKFKARIAGGKVIAKHQFPFFAQLQIPSEPLNKTHSLSYSCGATLFRAQWIITAGHCFHRLTIPLRHLELYGLIRVFMDTTLLRGFDAKINTVKKVHFHPHFVAQIYPDGTVERLENDIAIALLWYPYVLSKHIQVVRLPESDMTRCESGLIVGIGLTAESSGLSKYVLYAEVPSQSQLNGRHSSDTVFYSKTKWLGGHVLQGDSGGPFLCYRDGVLFQYGVVSTLSRSTRTTCITTYEDVQKHLTFIKENHVSKSPSHASIPGVFVICHLSQRLIKTIS